MEVACAALMPPVDEDVATFLVSRAAVYRMRIVMTNSELHEFEMGACRTVAASECPLTPPYAFQFRSGSGECVAYVHFSEGVFNISVHRDGASAASRTVHLWPCEDHRTGVVSVA